MNLKLEQFCLAARRTETLEITIGSRFGTGFGTGLELVWNWFGTGLELVWNWHRGGHALGDRPPGRLTGWSPHTDRLGAREVYIRSRKRLIAGSTAPDRRHAEATLTRANRLLAGSPTRIRAERSVAGNVASLGVMRRLRPGLHALDCLTYLGLRDRHGHAPQFGLVRRHRYRGLLRRADTTLNGIPHRSPAG